MYPKSRRSSASHTLPPFGSMGATTDSLCSFGPTHDSRWSMSAGNGSNVSHGIPIGHSLTRQPTSLVKVFQCPQEWDLI